ncbi:MAG: recombinase family protein [Candidatus Peribacteraceae bacterium]|nr:recombinase family protein [Candidatus Peribacteraceae bacterium]
MKPYLIYARRSTDDPENQKNSLEGQEKACRRHAKDHKLKISTESIEGLCKNGVIYEYHSGSKKSPLKFNVGGLVEYQIERPKFIQVIGLLVTGKIGGLLVLNWDRISRNDNDDTLIKDLIDDKEINIRFVEANYDHKSSAGKLHRNMDGVVAQFWSDKTSEAITKWHRKRREEGNLGNQAPIGYLDKGADRKEIDPVRAPIIRDLFSKYGKGGWGINTLTAEAERQGLLSKPRRRRRTKEEILDGLQKEELSKLEVPVGRGTIEGMLGNAFYIGKIRDLETGVWKQGNHPPLLIDEEGRADEILFYKVQAELKRKGHAYHSGDMDFYPYRKTITCTCGRSFSPYRAKGIIYYQLKCQKGCRNSIHNLSEDDIIKEVQRKIADIHYTEEELAEIDAGLADGLKKVSRQQKKGEEALGRRKQFLISKRRHLRDNRATLLSENYTPDDWREDIAKLSTEIEGIEGDEKVLSVTDKEMAEFVITFSELIREIGQHYEKAHPEEKQKITALIFSELQFFNGKLVKWVAKPEFAVLLGRSVFNGGRNYTTLELRLSRPMTNSKTPFLCSESLYWRDSTTSAFTKMTRRCHGALMR